MNSRSVKPTPNVLRKIPMDEVLSAPGRGKIRYIGGYVVAKLKYGNSKLLRHSLFVSGKEKVLNSTQQNLELLDKFCTTEAEICETTSDPDSLLETRRKQNISASLCNTTDATFNFFKELEVKGRDQNLEEQSTNMYTFVETNFRQDETCLTTFHCVLGEHEDQLHVYTAVKSWFKSAICLFVKVSICQFRRDFLSALKAEKGKALRKNIKDKTFCKPKQLDRSFIEKDQSENKDISHLRMKSELLENPTYLNTHMRRTYMMLLCIAYGINVAKKKKKMEIVELLTHRILECATMPNPEVLRTA